MILFYRGDIHSLSAVTYDRALFAGIKFDAVRLTVNAGITPKLTTMMMAARPGSLNTGRMIRRTNTPTKSTRP